ncbi:MAG: hypothetical protein LBI06_05460 [Treponema sp.]|jgi:hypothetical protein|nr:hypothetical protein [Treponema sp.]
MKNFLIIFLGLALLMPLFAQEGEIDTAAEALPWEGDVLGEDLSFGDDEEPLEKKPMTYARESFEFGLGIGGIGVGFDNGLMGIGNVLKKNIVVDLDEIASHITKDGVNINFDIFMNILFVNIKNIEIQGGIWDFGFSSDLAGDLNINLPESLFELISHGNINQRSFDGLLSASGGVFAGATLGGSAKYGKLRLGLKPGFYAPLVYVPKSGITYHLDSEDYLSVRTSGGISVYSPFVENGEVKVGMDLTLEGGYDLFPFLDLGGTFSQIPFVPVTLKNRMRLTMDEFEFEVKDLLGDGKIPEIPKLDFDTVYDVETIKAMRPMRFDVYARYKPFENEFLVVKPNLGFSVNFARERGYFNAGLEGQLNLKDLFKVHLGTGSEEGIWKHRLGFALNLRAFEWTLEATLRSQSFAGSFSGQGLGLSTGFSFGW